MDENEGSGQPINIPIAFAPMSSSTLAHPLQAAGRNLQNKNNQQPTQGLRDGGGAGGAIDVAIDGSDQGRLNYYEHGQEPEIADSLGDIGEHSGWNENNQSTGDLPDPQRRHVQESAGVQLLRAARGSVEP